MTAAKLRLAMVAMGQPETKIRELCTASSVRPSRIAMFRKAANASGRLLPRAGFAMHVLTFLRAPRTVV